MNRPAPTAPPRKCRAESRAVLIALLYAAAAALWIALSDSALATLARDPEQFLRFETYKGWLFVGVTALLLFLLMRWQFGELLAMQAASRRNEERLHSVLASIDDLVFVFDPDYRFVECYQPNEEKLLVPVAQFLGRRIDAIGLPPDVAARFIEAIDAAGREGAVSTVHYPLDVPVGKRWFSASLSRLEDGRGNFSGVTAVVRDITPLKQVEEAARSAQLLSDTLLDSLPSIFFVIDADGRLLRWNRVLETTTGRSADELAGCDALLLLPETARGAAARHVATAFEAGETQAELPLLDREQREIPHFFIAHRIVLEGRVCALGIGTDISERLISERRLLASEQRFRSLLTDIPNIAVQGYDADRRVIFWNPASERLYGYARDEALGRSLEDLIIPEAMRRTVVDLHHRWIEHGIPIPSGELDLRHKNGGSVPVYSSHALIRNSQNDLEMYCIDIDVQEARQAQSQLRLAAQVFDGSGEAILITDADKRILAVNTAFTRITGYDKEEILGRAPEYLSSGYHDAGFYQQMWHELHETGHWQGEIWNRRKNGETYPEWLGISAVRDDGGALTHYVGIFADISERKAIEAKLEYLAHHDPLTSLPNRLLVRDRLEQALGFAAREDLRIAVMFLDLDHFKVINDTLGHVIGDKLLQAIVGRLNHCVRDTDTISRQGGDEFLIALTGLHDTDAVSAIAQKILQLMQDTFEIEGHTLSCSFSIGIALYPDDGRDFDTLLLKADTAMYHAKEAGRNAYRFFTEQMNAQALDRLNLQNHLRLAIERGDLQLHYQPQVELATGRITGAEALLRWHSPELGPVPPARFIPVAEDSGLIVPIGEWVLREACRQAEEWRQRGLPPLVIAVNLSALQFKRNDPVALISQVLAESRLPAHCLELEITESLLVEDAEEALGALGRLKALGVRMAIDDFGTGYSSLAYLKRFPIDKLKIDQSFVRDIDTDPDDAAIVSVIVELGRILKLDTIAEGVENAQQLEFLTRQGCGSVQGYLFGRPMPAAQFAELIGRETRQAAPAIPPAAPEKPAPFPPANRETF